jgi:hypothetical protein
MSRNRGGNGPTSSKMVRDAKTGTIGFTSHDPAHGARVTAAPSYYGRNERWKQNISEEIFAALIKCVLLQHFSGSRNYRISKELVERLNCPAVMSLSELRWMQRQTNYDFWAKQVHSEYLLNLININRQS